MSNPVDDKALQEYLKGDSPVSQRYREIDAEEVPSHLDVLVLKQARDAVATAPSATSIDQSRLRQSRRRLMRWTVPATIAASMVLVVSIVIESGNRHLVTAPPEASPAVSPEAPPVVTAIPQSLRKDMAPADEGFNAPSESQPAPAPPSVLVPPVEKRSMRAASPMRAKKPVGVSAPAQAPQVQEESEKAAAAEKREESHREAPAPIAATSARQQSSVVESTSGIAASQRSAEEDLQEIAVTGSRAKRSVPPTAGPRGTITQNATPLERTEAMQDAASWRAGPETWLEHIRQLRAAGSGDEADREWKRFREAYPNYSVAETDAARTKR